MGMSWETLQQHNIPEWFKDVKFGIYCTSWCVLCAGL
ncbi:alpha-L-fucosidase [Flavivirga rizhaonensis]